MTKPRLHRLAELEIREAAAYYELQRAGLGEAFLVAIREEFEFLMHHPESCPTLDHGIRRGVLRAFPYSIFDRLDAERIFILAVAHQSREPHYWVRRNRRD